MKNIYGWISLFLVFVFIVFPLISVKGEDKAVSASNIVESNEVTFRLKDKESEKISVISARDYILGVVSAEMPASYHIEALKAQTVAAYTFALWRKNENKKEDFDITTDSNLDQAYIDKTARAKKWGEKEAEYTEKILNAVDAVLGQTVTFNGKIALTLYTAISGGKTENVKNLWGKEYSYLTPVESVGDLLSPNYLTTADFTQEQLKEKIEGISDIPISKWFSSPVYSDSGTLLSIKFGDKTFTGKEIRSALNLRSANFDVTVKDSVFTFNVRGYGHLVGMSQYGANYMAQQGSDYKEILCWYYKGTTVT